MKASSVALLLIAGFLLAMVSAGGNETTCLKCGRNMEAVGQGCACNQICNRKPSPCPLRPCLMAPLTECACLSGFCLPDENSNHCVKPDECTP